MASGLFEQLETSLGGRYVIERELDGGGMARVFLAEERALGRRVVIKVLAFDVTAAVSIERFVREVRIAARLSHPHIVPVLTAGEADGRPYYTMPFVSGESLSARLQREGALPVPIAATILRDVATALAYAHGQGVVHRDIKPGNVLLSGARAQVSDFGLAKAIDLSTRGGALTASGFTVGTPAYMAPEQVVADPNIDLRADLYALGVLAYEMLVGELPFPGLSPQATLAAHLTKLAPSLASRRRDIPKPLADIVMRCLAKDPSGRPSSANEVLATLEDFSGSATPKGAPRRRQHVTATIVVSTCVLFGLAAGAYLHRRTAASESARGRTTSIAVLPLTNQSGDTAARYFSDGITEELTSALNKVQGVRVASQTSAFMFRDRHDVSVQDIGRQLNVGTVLEGTIRRANGRLRVTAQLTNVADGLAVWSETYERPIGDVFAVEDSITRSIVASLTTKLSGGPRSPAPTTNGTNDLAAYDLYLRGLYRYANKTSAADIVEAIGLFRQAIARDHDFAKAYAELAAAWIVLPEYADVAYEAPLDSGMADARRALALDSTSAEAYAALGAAETKRWHWAAADSALSRALRFEPSSSMAHYRVAGMQRRLGNTESALAEFRRSLELDPLSATIRTNVGEMLALTGHGAEGLNIAEEGVRMAPTNAIAHGNLARTKLAIRDYSGAAAEFERAIALQRQRRAFFIGLLAYADGQAGRRDEARVILAELDHMPRNAQGIQTGHALAYLGLDDYDRALDWMNRAVDAHDDDLMWLSPAAHPIYDPMRMDSRFVRTIARAGLTSTAH